MNAMFFHGSANDLREEGFRDETCFGVPARGGGQRAAVAANEMFTFALLKGCCAPQVLQNAESRFDPLLTGLAFDCQ